MSEKDKPSNRGGDQVDVWYNASALPIDLFDGRMIAPGQVIREAIPMNPHNQHHVRVGSLVQMTRDELKALDKGEADQAKEEGEVTDG